LCVALLMTGWFGATFLPADVFSAEEYHWSKSDLDQWFYPAPMSPGTRILAPTFSALGGPGSATGPARRGATVIGFGTGSQLPIGLLPAQYEVVSARLTVTNAPGTGNIKYDPTYDSVRAVFSGTDDPGHPIELYGVGMTSVCSR
jgi:hypothetical protein